MLRVRSPDTVVCGQIFPEPAPIHPNAQSDSNMNFQVSFSGIKTDKTEQQANLNTNNQNPEK